MNMHPETKYILDGIISSKNHPQVMVFYGPNKEHKEQFALWFIDKLVNSSENKNIHKRIMENLHPDVQIYDAKGQDQYSLQIVKNWVDNASFQPFELSSKWIVIHDAEKLTNIHCNTLLKTLEEPDANIHFLLIVESLHDLLDTVNSRAFKIPFFALSKERIINEINLIDPLNSKEFMQDLARGSLSRLKEVMVLEKQNFFSNLTKAFIFYFDLKIHEAQSCLEEIEKLAEEDIYDGKAHELYSYASCYYLCLLKKIGFRHPTIYRYIPDIFSKNQQIENSLKRFTKLKFCLEQLIISYSKAFTILKRA